MVERTDAAGVVWGEIDGRVITFPMEVPDVAVATVLYDVPLAAAAALLPGDAFEIVETAPPEQFFGAPQTDRAALFLSQLLAH